MSCVKEPVQSSALGRVELPQVESPLLSREDPANEHDLDHVDKFGLLVHHVLNTCLESGQLSRTTPGQALLLPGGEPRGDARDPDCHPFMVSMKEPSSHVTLGILPTMAPTHSAWRPLTTFGLTLKVYSHKPK